MAKKQFNPSRFALEYEVLIACSNGKTGENFQPGDIVTNQHFLPDVIQNWLDIDPPVLRVRSADDGSNAKRKG